MATRVAYPHQNGHTEKDARECHSELVEAVAKNALPYRTCLLVTFSDHFIFPILLHSYYGCLITDYSVDSTVIGSSANEIFEGKEEV